MVDKHVATLKSIHVNGPDCQMNGFKIGALVIFYIYKNRNCETNIGLHIYQWLLAWIAKWNLHGPKQYASLAYQMSPACPACDTWQATTGSRKLPCWGGGPLVLLCPAAGFDDKSPTREEGLSPFYKRRSRKQPIS